MWSDQLPALASDYLAVAWDARGYGLSDDYEGPFNFADVCSDLVRVMDCMGKERAHIVGQSMGGLIAQDFHAREPARVHSLVLVDTTQSLSRSMTPEQIDAFIQARRAPLTNGIALADLAPSLVSRLIATSANTEVRRRLIEIMSELRGENYLKALETVTRYPGRPDLATVSVPTLVMVGALDEITPPAASRDLADRIPGAELVVLPNAGHMANMEKAEAFNTELRQFLRRL